MEDCNSENKTKKRVRDDSDSSGSKRVRVDSAEINSAESKRFHSDITELNSPDSDIRYDILDILDDPETVTDRDPEIQDLDSVIKSFEEEILHPAPASDSGELGYLLEASDDELGLPPAISLSDQQSEDHLTELVKLSSDISFELAENLGFENELPSYDSFEFGIGEETDGNNDGDNGEFVTLGGLFDFSESSDLTEFPWQPESLPAL